MTQRTYTVKELLDELAKYRPTAKVQIIDADTSWAIPKFSVCLEETNEGDIVVISPCDYSEMT